MRMRYVCSVCGYIYDEGREKQAFSELPDSWRCPVCKAAKAVFVPESGGNEPKAAAAPVRSEAAEAAKSAGISQVETPLAAGPSSAGEGLVKLSAGELSALCSNLARGCEKQYREHEAALFRELADYFAAVTPAVPDTDTAGLAALLQQDLEEGYPAVNAAADAAGDRGTKRVCVWGERVTNMLSSLLAQYQQEGEALLADTEIWVCTVCGFTYVGDNPPKLCPVCKVPAWKFEKMEGRDSA
jgi:rubrerythrin